ncbi:MAG TPA: hypothetical protein VH061_16620 [Solirubrobacteraceae bacterium]|jgi:hypothetical protein|nr:hypothetical protein [Solirubrobacteraceae bacterium]
MTQDELEEYLAGIGFRVEIATGADEQAYAVVLGVPITTGGLCGKKCDVGILRTESSPYVMASAIQTRPALVRMDSSEPLGTQPSPLGTEWQYWSRRYDHPPSPKRIWAHVLTILGDPRWEPA